MKKGSPKLYLALLLIALILWALYSFHGRFSPEGVQTTIRGFGIVGPIIFILIYAVAAVLFLPGSILTIAGGLIFGPVLGTLYNITGATLGATVAFVIARYLASDWIAAKSAGRLKVLMDGIAEEGWRFVAFVRLVPLFPFNLLNYALGITRIGLIAYIVSSAIFMLPGCIAWTYVGYVGGEAAAGRGGVIQKALLALALLAIVAYIPRIIKRLRKK